MQFFLSQGPFDGLAIERDEPPERLFLVTNLPSGEIVFGDEGTPHTAQYDLKAGHYLYRTIDGAEWRPIRDR